MEASIVGGFLKNSPKCTVCLYCSFIFVRNSVLFHA